MTNSDNNLNIVEGNEIDKVIDLHLSTMRDDIRSIILGVNKAPNKSPLPVSDVNIEVLRSRVRKHFKCIIDTDRVHWRRLLFTLKEKKKRLINWPSKILFPTDGRWAFYKWTIDQLPELLKVDIEDWSKEEKEQCCLSTVLIEDNFGQPLYTLDDLVMRSPQKTSKSNCGYKSDEGSYSESVIVVRRKTPMKKSNGGNSSQGKNTLDSKSDKVSKKREITVESEEEQTDYPFKRYKTPAPMGRITPKRLGSHFISPSFSPLSVEPPIRKV